MSAHLLVLQEQSLVLVLWFLLFILFISQIIITVKNNKKKTFYKVQACFCIQKQCYTRSVVLEIMINDLSLQEG